jgi:Protein of unknown function (DUF642)
MFRSVLAMLIALAAANARANLITNGSFETTTPAVSTGTCSVYGTGSTDVTGWTVVGAGGTDVAACNTSFTQSGISFVAEDGSNWVDLTGLNSNNDTEGVQQTIATSIGKSYMLSFWVGNVDSPSTTFGVTSTVDVSVDGTSLGAFTNSCTTCTTTLAWKEFSDSFTATTTSTTLTFLNGDPANDNSNGLDNVSLVANGSATVPEPSLLVPLGAGLLGLLGWRRLRSV